MQKIFALLLMFLLLQLAVFSQVVTECPQNIGFENGSVGGWQCYTGEISGTGRNFPVSQRPASVNVSPSSPIPGVHTLIPRNSGSDFFGGFSLDAPNGSNYVLKLGNEMNGRGAEAVSYTLRVPSGVESYSIIFNYAVVFQNPDHEEDEQPKFTAKVIDVASNSLTPCGSFEFTAPGVNGGIPGFIEKDSVMYKPWSPVMLNLTDFRGKDIRIEFTTNDCSRGRHFGYAYIDFDENCSIPILGNIVCPDNNGLTLSTITGMSGYRWFNAETSETLGYGETLQLRPVLPTGTKIGVELTPYDGLGCSQTLYTTITDIAMSIGKPIPSCKFVDITANYLKVGNSSDLKYTYWKDANAQTPLPRPDRITVDGTYYIKGTSTSGCFLIEPVNVELIKLDKFVIRQPFQVAFPASVDITKSYDAEPGMKYSYWRDPQASVRLENPDKLRRSGIFYIKKENNEGCSVISEVTVSVVLPDFFVPNTFTPNGDGINDEFLIIVGNNVDIKSFKIFNRYGKVVYDTPDIYNYWKGLYDNTNVPVGVYYWVMDGHDGENRFIRSGYVTVLR